MNGILELKDDGAGPRHYLNGKPVYCGTPLEILLSGNWVPVRYEADFRDGGLVTILITDDARIFPLRGLKFRRPNSGPLEGVREHDGTNLKGLSRYCEICGGILVHGICRDHLKPTA